MHSARIPNAVVDPIIPNPEAEQVIVLPSGCFKTVETEAHPTINKIDTIIGYKTILLNCIFKFSQSNISYKFV